MWETTSNGPTDHLWFMFLFRTYCRKWNDWDLPFLSFAFSNLWLMEDSRLLLESVTAFSTPGRGGREYGRKQPRNWRDLKADLNRFGFIDCDFISMCFRWICTHGTVHWKLTGTLQCCLPSSTVMHWKKKVFKRSRLHMTWEQCGKLTSGWCLLRSPNVTGSLFIFQSSLQFLFWFRRIPLALLFHDSFCCKCRLTDKDHSRYSREFMLRWLLKN